MRTSLWRIVAALVLALAIGAMTACGDDDDGNGSGAAGGGDGPRVAVLLSVGLDDTGYGRAAQQGIDQIEQELGSEVTAVDLIKPAEFASTMSDFARRGYDLVIANGVEFQDAAVRVAQQNRDTHFVVVNGFQAAPPNLSAFDFEWEQAGFLGGIAAGNATESNRLGNIGGVEIPPIQRLFHGFEQGAKEVKPDARVTTSYVGSFTDTGKAGNVAEAQMSRGIDVIWAIADTANPGIFDAAAQGDALVIGYGVDESDLAPDATLTTTIVDYGKVIFTAAQLFDQDNLEPRVYVQGFDQDVFDLAPIMNVDDAVAEQITETAERVKNGEFQIEKMKLE
jgi:basic membrane protein A and related proteins